MNQARGVLMLMANQLKQLAKDYNVFIFSATQVNAKGMEGDGEFKDESCIRGSCSCARKTLTAHQRGHLMWLTRKSYWDNLVSWA